MSEKLKNINPIHINMDKKVKNGGRKTTDPSMESLTKALYKAILPYVKSYNGPKSEEEMIKVFKGAGCMNAIMGSLLSSERMQKDLSKIKFDLENIIYQNDWICYNSYYDKDGKGHYIECKNKLGLQTLENGLSVLLCYAGGDWEQPVYFAIYFNGKELRAYIPEYGNIYNADMRCAIGNDEESDAKFLMSQKEAQPYFSEWDKHYEASKSELIDNFEFDEIYIAETLIDEALSFNFDAMWEDIQTRIKIVK